MAEYGEWNRKGAVLSDVTAQKEYGVTRDFILKGVQAGELEFREGVVWGNPYLRVLRSQLERYIVAQLGSEYLVSQKSKLNCMLSAGRLLPSGRNWLYLRRGRWNLSAQSKHSGIQPHRSPHDVSQISCVRQARQSVHRKLAMTAHHCARL
jgi:hypothetical protein